MADVLRDRTHQLALMYAVGQGHAMAALDRGKEGTTEDAEDADRKRGWNRETGENARKEFGGVGL